MQHRAARAARVEATYEHAAAPPADPLVSARALERGASAAFAALKEPWRRPASLELMTDPVRAAFAAVRIELDAHPRERAAPSTSSTGPGSEAPPPLRLNGAGQLQRTSRQVKDALADERMIVAAAAVAFAALPARWPHPSSSSTLLGPIKAALQSLAEQLDARHRDDASGRA